MKQPRSSSQANTRVTKKPLLPSFRQSKITSKVQQTSANHKNQVFLNIKLIPLQILCERKSSQGQKIIVNPTDIVIFQGSKINKTPLSIPSSSDKNIGKQWIQLNFGETYSIIKIKKIGDENAFGTNGQMICWDKNQLMEKKVLHAINIKEIGKNHSNRLQHNTQLKEDKNKQMKAFVANIMSKKLSRRSTEKNQIQAKFASRRQSGILRSKLQLPESQCKQQSYLWNVNPPSTAGSTSGISAPRSFRKQIINKTLLKDSKFTGNSQKQTSVGEQSIFLNNKLNQQTTHLSSVQNNEEYSKRKLKFDSQPYFYQYSTITSQFSHKNQSVQKFNSISRIENDKKEQDFVKNCIANTEAIQMFLDKSEHQSQEEVEEDIKRSAMMNSSIKNSDQQAVKKQKKQNEDESSCYESKQLESKAMGESSGTIYESKYQ